MTTLSDKINEITQVYGEDIWQQCVTEYCLGTERRLFLVTIKHSPSEGDPDYDYRTHLGQGKVYAITCEMPSKKVISTELLFDV